MAHTAFGASMRRSWKAALLALALPFLSACSGGASLLPDWLGNEKKETPLPGERIAILATNRVLQADPRLADLEVRLPAPWDNPDWPQAGGYANHAMHHLAAPGGLAPAWRASVGTGSSSERRIFASPIVADGKIFVMDAETRVLALDARTGQGLWQIDLVPRFETSGVIGGGIAYDNGQIYASTAYGEVIALNAANGQPAWRQRIGVPMRGAPMIDGGRLFVISIDNQLHALDAATGRSLWNHIAITESTGVLGAASPAGDSGLVVAPFSSGELIALRSDNGNQAWSEQLARVARASSVGLINDIAGRPVIDRGRVFAVTHAGRIVSIHLRSGERIWEREIASIQMPWIAGDYVYVVSTDGEVAALTRRDGRVRWVQALQRFRNPDASSNKGLITWYGPVLAGDRLILISSHGQAVSLSPYDGSLLGNTALPDGAAAAPIVANGFVYVLLANGSLLALR